MSKNLNENVLMMCFHKGPLVLHYVLVNAILQSIFTVLHRICLCAKVHNLVFIICPLLLGIYCVTYKSKVVESYIFLKKLFSSVWSPECWTWHFRASKFQNSLGKNAPSHPPPSKKGDQWTIVDIYLIQTCWLIQFLLKTRHVNKQTMAHLFKQNNE